jgi:DNA-binding MurR/RpiR family transcriptional regulator
MSDRTAFADRVAAAHDRLSSAERAVARFFEDNREEVLVASAAALASRIGTSDATVVRAAQALGYSGLDELRRQLADELRRSLSPAARLTRTLGAVNDDPVSAFSVMIDVHVGALEALRRDIVPAKFKAAVERVVAARRVVVFGLGPSSALADYFARQLGRFGLDSATLTDTGLLLADGLHRLRPGDLVVALAYGRVYKEIAALLAEASRLGIPKILLTDTLEAELGQRVDLVLPVARGQADWFSTHTATLGLIEALLVGIAAGRSPETVASLKRLNGLRAKLAGDDMGLPTSEAPHLGRRGASPRPRRMLPSPKRSRT